MSAYHCLLCDGIVLSDSSHICPAFIEVLYSKTKSQSQLCIYCESFVLSRNGDIYRGSDYDFPVSRGGNGLSNVHERGHG